MPRAEYGRIDGDAKSLASRGLRALHHLLREPAVGLRIELEPDWILCRPSYFFNRYRGIRTQDHADAGAVCPLHGRQLGFGMAETMESGGGQQDRQIELVLQDFGLEVDL